MAINHETEAAIVAEVGHEYGCFERIAEELIESGDARTGEVDEILADGRELIEHFEEIARVRCTCRSAETAEEAEAWFGE